MSVSRTTTSDAVAREVDSATAGIFARHAMVGAVIGVVRDGRLESLAAHGCSDIGTRRPVTEDTVFRVASITKTFTAIAIMQLWERGLVDLDAPAQRYLRAYRLVPGRPEYPHPTLRHLLTHTAGLGETARPGRLLLPDFGESVAPGHPVGSLADYYRGELTTHAEPGTRWTYSNHGFATLGQIVEDVSGVPLAAYLREHVFEPLGMHETTLSPAGYPRARLATGYTFGRSGPRPVPLREMVTAGAASAFSTARDMGRYLAALTGGGANEFGAVLPADTMGTMFEPHYRPDSRIPGMGLGFFRAEFGGRRLVEHQGILTGFDSQIWVAPDAGLGVMAFTNGAHRAMLWLPAETSDLMRTLLGVAADRVRDDVAQQPAIWSELCGNYRVPGRITDVRAKAMVGAGLRVEVRRGQLVLRVLGPVPALRRGIPLRPDDPDDPEVFRMDLTEFGLGSVRVVFARSPLSGATAMHLEVTPLTAHRLRR
ncbi:serine hydrolase domain-containing protein [Nocardia bovistercoris]|uniref:Beta-lactamase family protein n=1 Tax=Nocardia bovistercoris TaxID=2785916 RepID=A0A931IHW7_9NOCA|nr:serine hydrolase domain-containing protein [Nocardia bovistercoris]MBH0781739.1 beta-lactamase family protein [Nocardia bovistercoris]